MYNTASNFLPFDTGKIIDINEIKNLSRLASDKDQTKNRMVHLKTLIPPMNKMKAPFLVCDYFSVPYNLQHDGEHIWEKVEDIKMQVFRELTSLIDDGNDYFCDFNSDGSFGVFVRRNG